jgi:uncharacterized protein
MTVAVSGASGLIGQATIATLADRGHTIKRLVRHPARDASEIEWNPTAGTIDATGLRGVDAVINLSGETLAQRWTARARHRIVESRVKPTLLLARTLASLSPRPTAFLSASAVGIYGSRGDAMLDETSPLGDDFLADVCKQWEAATQPASDAGIRVVSLRTAVVLSSNGGMLAKLLPVFRAGFGGRLGNGQNWLSWIAHADCAEAIAWIAAAPAARGPVNLVAPNPVTNAEFTRVLAHVLGRPGVLTVPRIALKLALGEMAQDTILASQRVAPRRLLEWGFEFACPTLESALRQALADRSATRSAR